MAVQVTKGNILLLTGYPPGAKVTKANLLLLLDPETPGPTPPPTASRRRQFINN